ncbi:DUF6177 family protein [Streptomyces sp. NPDC008313]|uniref:DUF6177 family protein n=1 Tax=Streptomyces sp. NPDC008313 TaxID=3364826 RepID=UPI0036E0DCE4
MTKDVIALTPKMPDTWSLVAGLYAGGPDLELTAAADGAVLQLSGPGGRPLVSVEAPVLVQVPGEAGRLLGQDVPVPFWWTEARAATAVPEAERLAGAVCGRLNALLGGTTWPPGAAGTDVVDLDGVTASDTVRPTVDVVTESTAVVLVDRPVVAVTSWLSEIFRVTAAGGRALHIVTPPHVRLSAPARTLLAQAPNRWVVQDPDAGYHDGLSGAVLHWKGGTFAPVLRPTADGTGVEGSVAEAFARTAPAGERQLVVAIRTRLPADERLVLGRALESAWEALTGAAPAGWGTAEPVNLPWSTRQLTDLARDRAPEPSAFVVVGDPGRPAVATMRVTRTSAGVEEDITLTLGFGEDEAIPLDALEGLAGTLVAKHGLVTMLTSLRAARRDLTAPPRLEAPPVPYTFTLGPADVSAIGVGHARRPPLALSPVPLGPAAAPGLHYPLGDALDPEAWPRFRRLTAHLGAV